ncbi:response regulator [Limibaculum sp. FT325]|uniref:response regulator n=1 Tax=Thermohalobaculum sediminis TaxID=2939436 RepID=UPI0020BE9EBB|nr:response regulator [Limibaculum sediminis]MCL5776413.1 response regulator [Limibaculum sediminis]
MTVRILVVDDEADVADLFRQNFRREIRAGRYRFDFAFSATEALDVLRHGVPPDILLVLSDINMPGMSGVDLLAAIRAEWPKVAVCMITAYGDAATETQVRTLGAEAFLTKPVDFEKLRRQVAEALGDGA